MQVTLSTPSDPASLDLLQLRARVGYKSSKQNFAGRGWEFGHDFRPRPSEYSVLKGA